MTDRTGRYKYVEKGRSLGGALSVTMVDKRGEVLYEVNVV